MQWCDPMLQTSDPKDRSVCRNDWRGKFHVFRWNLISDEPDFDVSRRTDKNINWDQMQVGGWTWCASTNHWTLLIHRERTTCFSRLNCSGGISYQVFVQNTVFIIISSILSLNLKTGFINPNLRILFLKTGFINLNLRILFLNWR